MNMPVSFSIHCWVDGYTITRMCVCARVENESLRESESCLALCVKVNIQKWILNQIHGENNGTNGAKEREKERESFSVHTMCICFEDNSIVSFPFYLLYCQYVFFVGHTHYY